MPSGDVALSTTSWVCCITSDGRGRPGASFRAGKCSEAQESPSPETWGQELKVIAAGHMVGLNGGGGGKLEHLRGEER